MRVCMFVCVGRGGRYSRAVLARDSRRRVRAHHGTHRYAPRVIDGDQLLVSVNGVPVRGGRKSNDVIIEEEIKPLANEIMMGLCVCVWGGVHPDNL